MVWNLGSISNIAYSMIDNVPSTVSGTPMQNFAEMSLNNLRNWTGLTISSASIDDKYSTFLINQTAGYTLLLMSGQGADFNWSLGEFSITKARDNPNVTQSDIHFKIADESLKNLPKEMPFYKALG